MGHLILISRQITCRCTSLSGFYPTFLLKIEWVFQRARVVCPSSTRDLHERIKGKDEANTGKNGVKQVRFGLFVVHFRGGYKLEL